MNRDKKDFFISYNKSDEQWATWIAWQLEDNGYTTLIQAWDFKPGNNFVTEMHHALTDCKKMIAILSPQYLESLYCQAEWTAAFTKDPSCEKALFIPVRVKECTPEGLLAPIVYIDLWGLEEDKAIRTLLNGVNTNGRPKNRPGFPGAVSKPRFPEQLPFNNLPYIKNPHFTGRDDILETIRKSFESGQYISLTQSISGLGGVGKTQLVLEYAVRYAYLYDMIWWVDAESFETLLKSYTDFAHKLGIIDKTVVEKDIVIESVWNWMAQHENWLFIYDNAERPNIIQEFHPRKNTGNILLTSRYTGWESVGKEIELYVFTRPTAVNFLINRTGIDNKEFGGELAKALGYLPLALEQAAAYIINNHIGFDEYLKLFEKYKLKLFQKQFSPSDYSKTLEVTWNVTIEKIQNEHSWFLLCLCSFFAPDNIDPKILRDVKCLPEPLASSIKDDLEYNKIIHELTKYSLIKQHNGLISIHNLVQLAVIRTLEKEVFDTFIMGCLHIMNERFDFDKENSDMWKQFSDLIPHALSIADHSIKSGVDIEGVAHIFYEIGRWNHHMASYHKAIDFYEKAREIVEEEKGQEHNWLAYIFNNLGLVYTDMANYDKALLMYEKSLRIRVSFDPESLGAATTYDNIGWALKQKGEYQQALKNHKKALKITQKLVGDEHINAAKIYNNIGMNYYELGFYSKSIDYLTKSVTLTESVLGVKNHYIATAYSNIALAYEKKQEFEKAIKYHKKAVVIREEFLGLEHPSTASSYSNIGLLLNMFNFHEEALEHLNKALNIFKLVYGEEHPETATAHGNIALVYLDIGEYDKALDLYKKAFGICQLVLGDGHPDTLSKLNNIASVHYNRGQLKEAIQIGLKAMKIIKVEAVEKDSVTQLIEENLKHAFLDLEHEEAKFEEWLEKKLTNV